MPFLTKLFSRKASLGHRDWERLPQRRSAVSCSPSRGRFCPGRPPHATLEGPRGPGPGCRTGLCGPRGARYSFLGGAGVYRRVSRGSLTRGFSRGSACPPQVGQEGGCPVGEAWPQPTGPAAWTRLALKAPGGGSCERQVQTPRGGTVGSPSGPPAGRTHRSPSGQSSGRTGPLAGSGVTGATSPPRPPLSTPPVEPAGWARAGRKPGVPGPAPRPVGACGRSGGVDCKAGVGTGEAVLTHTVRVPLPAGRGSWP